jgi:hypothetical protein
VQCVSRARVQLALYLALRGHSHRVFVLKLAKDRQNQGEVSRTVSLLWVCPSRCSKPWQLQQPGCCAGKQRAANDLRVGVPVGAFETRVVLREIETKLDSSNWVPCHHDMVRRADAQCSCKYSESHLPAPADCILLSRSVH